MSQEHQDYASQPISLSSFKIIKSICSGRNPVYHAYNNKSNSQVILKTFSYISRPHEGYIREKSSLLKLNHPNIIQLIEAVDMTTSTIGSIEQEVSYITLEYAPYGDLFEIINTRGQMSEILSRTLFHQLIDAIAYLHRRNIAHMDLKLDNILLDEKFNLKLIDFDLSQTLDSSSLKSKGTPGYRAPELKKDNCVDLQAADVYSAAIILFIMVTGYPPYTEVARGQDSQFDAYYRILRSNTARFWEVHSKHKGDPSFYSEDFKALVTKMLAEAPEDRPTMNEIITSAWYQGPTLKDEDFNEEMKRYFNTK